MRRKRFKHQAFTLCHMFCGWQLHVGRDLSVLGSYGQGTLRIDALTAECWIDGASVQPLDIAYALRLWLHRDADTNSIELNAVDAVILEVEFEVDANAPHYYESSFRCRSQIRSGEHLYSSGYESGVY